MKALSRCVASLALAAAACAQPAHRTCAVSHRDCYPACVERTGSDCAKTKQVCREICGPDPTYPSKSNTEGLDRDVPLTKKP